MRKARRALYGMLATVLCAAVAFAVPAGSAIAASDGSGSHSAVEAKKKCKKKKKHRKCKKKKKKKKQQQSGGAYLQGRYSGTYAENATDLLFNVSGGRVYTGPFDSFFIEADCTNLDYPNTVPQAYTDPSAIEPVQASIASNGDFAGSGVYTPGFGLQIPWQLSGHISGTSITGGAFTAGPYTDTYGDPCGGTTHFTAQWYGDYTL